MNLIVKIVRQEGILETSARKVFQIVNPVSQGNILTGEKAGPMLPRAKVALLVTNLILRQR